MDQTFSESSQSPIQELDGVGADSPSHRQPIQLFEDRGNFALFSVYE